MREITPQEKAILDDFAEKWRGGFGKAKGSEPKPKALPGFERYHHVGSYKRPNRHLAEVREAKKPLDALNDSLPLGCSLHPTKGWRSRGEKSLKADLLYGEVKHDLRAWLRTWLP